MPSLVLYWLGSLKYAIFRYSPVNTFLQNTCSLLVAHHILNCTGNGSLTFDLIKPTGLVSENTVKYYKFSFPYIMKQHVELLKTFIFSYTNQRTHPYFVTNNISCHQFIDYAAFKHVFLRCSYKLSQAFHKCK